MECQICTVDGCVPALCAWGRVSLTLRAAVSVPSTSKRQMVFWMGRSASGGKDEMLSVIVGVSRGVGVESSGGGRGVGFIRVEVSCGIK